MKIFECQSSIKKLTEPVQQINATDIMPLKLILQIEAISDLQQCCGIHSDVIRFENFIVNILLSCIFSNF